MPEEAAVLYVDGHAVSTTDLKRAYPSITWRASACVYGPPPTNAMDGQPFFVVSQTVDSCSLEQEITRVSNGTCRESPPSGPLRK